ncbi:MAG: TrpR YerC/YecD [Eubacterium sp.]|nr:TrpR YerC/YecD [Eubacterium sp.]
MEKTIRTNTVDAFFDAILCLEGKEELYQFFDDVCTTNEVVSIAQRFAVAKMLYEEKTYIEIAKETGASTATISRVNRSMIQGNGSYERIFERLGITKPGK